MTDTIVLTITFFYRTPQSLAECLHKIQQLIGIRLPEEEGDWYDIPRMEVDIRRSHVLEDALREARKKFDPCKVLKVYNMIIRDFWWAGKCVWSHIMHDIFESHMF